MSRHIAGVLLAGGLSRRMGGIEKSLCDLGGRPLIAHAAERLAPQVDTLVVNANGDPNRFASLGIPVVPDDTPDFAGPLAGILATLRWLERARPHTTALASVSADAPFIPPDLVRSLEAALSAQPAARVAVAQSRGRRHHVIALWSPAAAADIASALARGDRKVEAMVDRLGAVSVAFPDCDVGGEAVDPFFNVNTPADLAFAQDLLSRAPSAPAAAQRPFVVGVAGWKNSGKTTLVERLVAELTRRGYSVSTVKHSHHEIAAERQGTDSDRHRQAGAREVALVTSHGWWLLTQRRLPEPIDTDPTPSLAHVIGSLAPVDIVIVEGFKAAAIPKIEVRRMAQGPGDPLAGAVPGVLAIAADHAVEDPARPVFALDDIAGLTQALLAAGGLAGRRKSTS